MVKKKKIAEDILDVTGGLVLGGTSLTLGSSLIGTMPTTTATAGIQSGFTTGARFFPTIATIGAFNIVGKQLKKTSKKLKKN